MRLIVACVPAFAVAVSLANAQRPVGASSLDDKAVADSLNALRDVAAQISRSRRDGAAWHRQGMIAWALAIRSDSSPRIGTLDGNRLLRLADTSLRIAASLEPQNGRYRLDVGVLLRHAPEAIARLAAVSFVDAALDRGRAIRDRALISDAAAEAGRIRWLRYEVVPNRMPPCARLAFSVDSAAIRGDRNLRLPTEYAFKTLHNQLIDCFGGVGMAEGADYSSSERYFREAHASSPTNARVFRHLAMLLAERRRWRELEAIARQRSEVVSDAAAWMALGLALHRSGASKPAAVAFDSAVKRHTEGEQRRLFSLTRLLGPNDSLAWARENVTQRAERERNFWGFSTPLWSRASADPKIEFLARVAFAEMRWTVDELGVRGADSDRGALHIRYGPADRTYVLRGCDFYKTMEGCNPLIEDNPGNGTHKPLHADVITYWDYDNGLTLVFWGMPTYGTAYVPIADRSHIAAAIDIRPASFDNIATERIVDITTRLTRFRAPGDSTDMLLAMQAPIPSIREASSVDVPARIDFWMFPRDRASGREYRDSAQTRGSGIGRWIYRLPANEYFYRIEATADGSMLAARTMGWVTAGSDTANTFGTRGFGLSDVLLATEARANSANASRWTDFSVAPVLAPVARGSTLHVLWETYEPGAANGQADYEIELILERQRSTAGQIVARVVNALARAVRIDREPDRVTYRYERTTAHAAALVDLLSLNLAETPPGTYAIAVRVRDRATGRTTSSSSLFEIRD